jgi:hypothetical protein
MLSRGQLDAFAEQGFVALPGLVPRTLVEAACRILWREAGCDPDDPAGWTRPVIRLGYHAEPPFAEAVSLPPLRAAFDQLVGAGRWLPRRDLGSFVLRFPHPDPPGDDGWHVDAGFPGPDPADFFAWRINAASRGRGLLMLFLLTDTGDEDAPTRLRAGSHRSVAELLAPAGEAGLSFLELAGRLEPTAGCPEMLATGEAGTVYLCHPLLAHAGQAHRGRRPRILAQPPLHPAPAVGRGGDSPGAPG